MTKALYEAKENNKQLYIAEHGAHACSYNENKESTKQPSINFKHICERNKNRLA